MFISLDALGSKYLTEILNFVSLGMRSSLFAACLCSWPFGETV